MTRVERVASITRQTAARRSMIHNSAFSIHAASAWAGVYAFVSDACSLPITISVKNTFWSTSGIRVPCIFRQARARSSTVTLFTNCICTTWRWITRVADIRYRLLSCKLIIWISFSFHCTQHTTQKFSVNSTEL